MKKNILITGSTDGIGKLAAIKLAKDGHEIYLHGRNTEKLSRVISEIKELTNNNNISGFVADFSNLDDVRQMAIQVKNKVSNIDVLINNAGVFKSPINQTKDGLDVRFVVNYFAPYLLTKELLPVIGKETGSRIINLSSAAQLPVSYEVFSGKKQLSVREVYAQSKLALTMWSFHLARTIQNIVVIAVNPGSLLNTNMVKEGFGHFWSSADKGGNILYELAVSDLYQGITGKYFDNDKGDPKGDFGKAHPDAYDEAKIEKLTEMTERILNA